MWTYADLSNNQPRTATNPKNSRARAWTCHPRPSCARMTCEIQAARWVNWGSVNSLDGPLLKQHNAQQSTTTTTMVTIFEYHKNLRIMIAIVKIAIVRHTSRMLVVCMQIIRNLKMYHNHSIISNWFNDAREITRIVKKWNTNIKSW